MKDEFFVGYSEEMPESFRKKVKNFVWVLAIALPVIGLALVMSQQGFSSGTYELGRVTQLQGKVITEPIPMLQLVGEQNAEGLAPAQTILLMSFGKKGAEKDLEVMSEKVRQEAGKELHEVLLTLEGTLDYRDGNVLFEFTKQADALIEIAPLPSVYPVSSSPQMEALGAVSLSGEIVDSKCYFGTMKPGEGKPHRSCAIRCISGGIPPILMVQNEAGEKEAYLLRGKEGQAINQELLSVVADPVVVKGSLSKIEGWNVLQIDPAADIERVKRK